MAQFIEIRFGNGEIPCRQVGPAVFEIPLARLEGPLLHNEVLEKLAPGLSDDEYDDLAIKICQYAQKEGIRAMLKTRVFERS